MDALVSHAQGDARRALNTLEAVLQHVASLSHLPSPITRDVIRQVLEKPLPVYDKSGDQHYNLISALHKPVRGSDVEGSLYWLARMLAGGEAGFGPEGVGVGEGNKRTRRGGGAAEKDAGARPPPQPRAARVGASAPGRSALVRRTDCRTPRAGPRQSPSGAVPRAPPAR